MPKIKTYLLLFLLLGYNCLINTVEACSECTCSFLGGAGTVGPIITQTAYTLPKGRSVIGTSLNYVDFSGFSSDKFKQLNNNFEHAHSHGNNMNLSLNAAYGVTDDFTLSLNLPYNFLFDINSTDGFGNTVSEGDSIGFGDLVLMGKYRLFDQASLIAGIKMATGQTNQKDEYGYRLSSDHQPGTGSWDPIMGFAVSKQISDQVEIDANLLYRLSTPGFDNLIIGDVVNYNFAVSHDLSKLDKGKLNIDAVLELNAKWQEKAEYQAIKDEGHGGTRVFLTPGLRLVYDDTWIASMALGFPIIESMNGEQPDANVQLFFSLARIF